MQEQEEVIKKTFLVGSILDSLKDQPPHEAFRQLASTPQLFKIPIAFVEELKSNLDVFTTRIDVALHSTDERVWKGLCDQPLQQIKAEWRSSTGGSFSDLSLLIRDQCLLLYYCVYVVMLWCHPLGHMRYWRGVVPVDLFVQRYQADTGLLRENLEKGRKTDSWEKLFHYRNVLVLASAIKPTKRNKCLFIKIGCLLAEGRIHTLGGGQSFTAHRRCHVFTREENVFAPAFPQPESKYMQMKEGKLLKKNKDKEGGGGGKEGKKEGKKYAKKEKRESEATATGKIETRGRKKKVKNDPVGPEADDDEDEDADEAAVGGDVRSSNLGDDDDEEDEDEDSDEDDDDDDDDWPEGADGEIPACASFLGALASASVMVDAAEDVAAAALEGKGVDKDGKEGGSVGAPGSRTSSGTMGNAAGGAPMGMGSMGGMGVGSGMPHLTHAQMAQHFPAFAMDPNAYAAAYASAYASVYGNAAPSAGGNGPQGYGFPAFVGANGQPFPFYGAGQPFPGYGNGNPYGNFQPFPNYGGAGAGAGAGSGSNGPSQPNYTGGPSLPVTYGGGSTNGQPPQPPYPGGPPPSYGPIGSSISGLPAQPNYGNKHLISTASATTSNNNVKNNGTGTGTGSNASAPAPAPPIPGCANANGSSSTNTSNGQGQGQGQHPLNYGTPGASGRPTLHSGPNGMMYLTA